MFNHFIWDFDGTLCDTYPVMAKSLESALGEFGISEDGGELMARLKISSVATIQYYRDKHGLGDDFADINRKWSLFYADEAKLFDGAYDICKAIWEKGYKNYLYTHRGASTHRYMETTGLSPFFTDCVTSENGFRRKPDPEGIKHLLNKHNLPATETVMIGDREVDMESAKNAGITACFFIGTHADSQTADFKFKSLREIEGLF